MCRVRCASFQYSKVFKVLAPEILKQVRYQNGKGLKWYRYLVVGEGKDKLNNYRSVRLLSSFLKNWNKKNQKNLLESTERETRK